MEAVCAFAVAACRCPADLHPCCLVCEAQIPCFPTFHAAASKVCKTPQLLTPHGKLRIFRLFRSPDGLFSHPTTGSHCDPPPINSCLLGPHHPDDIPTFLGILECFKYAICLRSYTQPTFLTLCFFLNGSPQPSCKLFVRRTKSSSTPTDSADASNHLTVKMSRISHGTTPDSPPSPRHASPAMGTSRRGDRASRQRQPNCCSPRDQWHRADAEQALPPRP